MQAVLLMSVRTRRAGLRRADVSAVALMSAVRRRGGLAIGAEVPITSNDTVCYALELFIPALLRARFVEWKREALMGSELPVPEKWTLLQLSWQGSVS